MLLLDLVGHLAQFFAPHYIPPKRSSPSRSCSISLDDLQAVVRLRLGDQISRPPPPSTADIERFHRRPVRKSPLVYVSAAFSCGATKPFCANLNRDRLISFLRSLSVVCRSISPSASTAAGSKNFAEEKITARSVSRPFPKLCFQRRHEGRRRRVDGYTKFRSAASPTLISSSCDLFLAKSGGPSSAQGRQHASPLLYSSTDP